MSISVRTIKPTLLKGPADVMVTEDEEAIFVATLTGKPEPTVQWYALPVIFGKYLLELVYYWNHYQR